MIDVATHVNAVQRRVGERTLAAGEARAVILTRAYPAPVQEVWDAATDAERIPRWFLPISGELRLGGRYQLQGNAGGTIERCEPPHEFAATWEFAGSISWIEVRLSPGPDDTTVLELEHIALVADDDKWAQFGPGAVGVGWDHVLMGLSLHLEAGGGMGPAEATAWVASEAGRQFASLTSQRWGDAHIAAGGAPSEAHAAAERTAAFYTGTEPGAD